MKKTHPLPPIDRKREELPPDERELPHGKIIKMYKNGDKFRPAKPILFNESHFSSWEIFLDEVQEKLKFERPVRSIYTPEGGTEVYTFEQIQDDHAYVAASGKFEPFRYTAIESHSPRPSKINKSNFNSRIEPVVHSRIRQDARFRQSQTLASRAKRITVAINNDDIDHSHVVLIPAKKVNNLQAIIETIDDDLNNNRGIQFRVEYLVDTDTEEVCTHPEDIIEDHIYVACNKGRRYIPKTYSKDGRKNFVVIPSPRPLQRPKFIWERSNLNGSRDNKRPSEFYTLRTLPPIGSKNYKGSPDNSVTSNPEYGSRKKPHQANGAIHTKPQKHKRTPEKKAKQTDYDKDDGGVFKAKDTNKHTKGAREVGETKDTRTDLPIDQVPAEEVKEETLYEEENTAKVPSEITLTHKQSAEGEEDDEIYDHHGDHYDDDDDNDEDEKIKSQKTPKAPQNSNKDKNSKTSTKPDKKETTHKTNSKTNNNNNTNNNKTNNNNNTNNKTNPKPADHSHGAKDPAPKKHSGTRGEFNNVSPLPGIGKNDTNRSSTPVGRNGFDSPTQQEKDLAAAKIQANYRGHKTRQELAKQKEGTKKNDAANKPPDTKMDAASKPPDTKKDAGKKPESKTKEDEAATKIQAGFRGHKTRQDLKKQKENQQDDKANAQQDQKQQNAPSAQSNNPAPSQSDQTAPKGNQTAPKADQTAPKADQTAPKGDQTAPKADQTAPKGDQTAPKADQTAPKGDQTAPKTDQTAPKGDQTAPNADQTNPKGDQTAPKEDQTAPKGDQTAPKGDNAAQKTDGTSQKGVKPPSTAGSSKPPSTAGP
ncbi:doublecortin domain-containing protein 2-like [Crassostrea angulata]|uniref:doublecortin domain-containing protein 2-like n=1 Tax=Magallana angulata TaxID=2784310 RepID=UPI0022B1643C|nr:doublecortin domain-containing protein 2-like [Crassostrea angulata]